MRTPFALLLSLLLAVVFLGAGGPDPERARASLLQADMDLCRAMKERDLDRFASMVAEDAVFFGRAVARGREEVRAAWAPLFEGPEAPLVWEPVRAEVSASGNLGYTIGVYLRRERAEDGSTVERSGNYVSIWRLHPDGSWKAVVDIGTLPNTAPYRGP
jgi:ketosteroid isomerase-like protein